MPTGSVAAAATFAATRPTTSIDSTSSTTNSTATI